MKKHMEKVLSELSEEMRLDPKVRSLAEKHLEEVFEWDSRKYINYLETQNEDIQAENLLQH